MSEFVWDDKKVINMAQRVTETNMKRAVKFLEDVTKKALKHKGTGRLYKRKSVKHRASSPGQAPALDTGVLMNSITNEVAIDNKGNVTGKVGSDEDYIKSKSLGTDVNYGYYLEVGTRNIKRRPWLVSTRNKNLKQIAAILEGKK